MDKVSDQAKLGKQVLQAKMDHWLETEGFPVEFKSAFIFHKGGFAVRQGSYVKNESGTMREIDVLASVSELIDDVLFRISFVVECKSSIDKPWVVFTSRNTVMAPSACVSQTISSSLGAASIWTVAGNADVHRMKFFRTPAEGGFGGRQAFSKGNDYFYNAVQGAISNANAYAKSYDASPRKPRRPPSSAVLVFPLVVIDAHLYRGYFDDATGRMKTEEAKSIRCHWQGSNSDIPHVTIDIVPLDHLENFINGMIDEASELIHILKGAVQDIDRCCEAGSFETLNISGGPRGTLGAPPLIRTIISEIQQKKIKGLYVKKLR